MINILEKWLIAERKGWNVGLGSTSRNTCMDGCTWPYSVQDHFGVICCILQHYDFLNSSPPTATLIWYFYNLWQSIKETIVGILKFVNKNNEKYG